MEQLIFENENLNIVKNKKKESVTNIIDLFDSINIDNESILSEEDNNKMKEFDSLIEPIKENYSKYISFIKNNELPTIGSYSMVNTDDICKSINKWFASEVANFTELVYEYFENKYSVKLVNNFYCKVKYGSKTDGRKKLRKDMSSSIIVEDILEQLGDITFGELSTKQMKEAIPNSQAFYNFSVKGKNISFNIRGIHWEKSYDGIHWRTGYNHVGNAIKPLLDAISHYEWNSCCIHQSLNYLNTYSYDDTYLSEKSIGEKVTSIKFFKNGKIQLKFANSIFALEFAKDYCDYHE